MSYLLDTDTCSTIVKRPAKFSHRLQQYAGRLAIAASTYGELCVWVGERSDGARLREAIDRELLSEMSLLPFDRECAEAFGSLRVDLRRRGLGMAPIDLQIAATAVAHGLTLVTHNTRHFEVIPGLPLEDWVTG